MVKTFAVQNAGLCGRDMLTVRENVINRIVQDENLGPAISIGVGVTFDSVIVTKIGIADSYDVKAFGDCINIASHYANEVENKVKVSKKSKRMAIQQGWRDTLHCCWKWRRILSRVKSLISGEFI